MTDEHKDTALLATTEVGKSDSSKDPVPEVADEEESRNKQENLPQLTMEEAIPMADQVFMQIHQQCLLPRGLQPRDLFDAIDADGSGEITLEEFREGLFQKFGMELENYEFAAVCKVADSDGSGSIEMGELIVILQRGENAEACADRIFHSLWQNLALKGMRVTMLFHLCDDDRSGEITLDELRGGMDTVLGMKLTEYEFGCVSKVADKDGSGDISVKELVRIVARGDQKRKKFRKKYNAKMKIASKSPMFRVNTPVTPVSDLGDAEKQSGRLIVDTDGLEKFEQRTPSPVDGHDMMGMNVFDASDPDQSPVRPTPWTKTDDLLAHKPPAARRKEFIRAVGRPDLWHLKLRQQNYHPENILVARNRETNRVRPLTKRNAAIEAARRVAKLYHDGPPVHGSLEGASTTKPLSLVEKAARNEIFGQSELLKLAKTVKKKSLLVAPKSETRRQPGATKKVHMPTDNLMPSTFSNELSCASYVSGGSALPNTENITLDNTLADGSFNFDNRSAGSTSSGTRPCVSKHLESIASPPYWRKRTKHPSAQHSLKHSGNEPRLCYSPRVPKKSKRNSSQGPNSKHRSLKPSKRKTVPRFLDLDGDGELDEDELLIADLLEGKANTQHIAMEDVSNMLARRSAKQNREKFKTKKKKAFARAVFLGEPAAISKVILIQEQSEDNDRENSGAARETFTIDVKRKETKPVMKAGSLEELQHIQKAKKHALHSECKSYTRGKLVGLAGDKEEQAIVSQKDAIEELDEIAAFEKRRALNGHEWEPVTGKDWNREQRFLQNVLTRHSKDKRLANGFTQFQKDYRKKKKEMLKKVADKGYEYIRAVNKLHYRSIYNSNNTDPEYTKTLRSRLSHLGLDRKPKKSARQRLKGGIMSAKMKVKGDKVRAKRLKAREARILSLRQFSGFGRRHLEFISEQMYLNIMRTMGEQGGTKALKKPMKIMEEAFDAIDEDLSGTVSAREFRQAMVRLDLGLSQEAIDELMQVIDNDGNGELDKVEFLRAMKYVDQKMTRMSYEDDY